MGDVQLDDKQELDVACITTDFAMQASSKVKIGKA